ncbi:unnamed protein product [Anisakis simplex]|uniref:Flavodoxin-like domain-containing protein n=1 Tax=Anisakis simplex TaxID=6269 RepID=A0A0M3JZI5_ANISI|nr:unnamed protein product [Anisakis simplex]
MPGGLSGTKVGGGQTKTSSLESLVRAAEKDDLLLYLTAICGIFMPGIVYILYHYLHKMYENYSKKREEERLIEERERSAVTVFFASDNDEAQRLAHLVSERLAHESPPVIDLAYVDIEDFSNFKGIGIFLISSGKKGREPESVEWFFDWLEELGSDNKRSKKHRRFFECRKMHFAIFGIDNFMLRGRSNTRFNRAAQTLARRLRSIGAKPICRLYLADRNRQYESIEQQADSWADRLLEAIDEFTLPQEKQKSPMRFLGLRTAAEWSSSADSNYSSESGDEIESKYFTRGSESYNRRWKPFNSLEAKEERSESDEREESDDGSEYNDTKCFHSEPSEWAASEEFTDANLKCRVRVDDDR